MGNNYYHLWDEIRKLPTLSQAKRDAIINELASPGAATDYSFPNLINELMPFVNKTEAIKLFDNMMSHHRNRRSYYEDTIYATIKKTYDFDKTHVKKSVLDKNDDAYDKAILLFESLTAEEEARGLRALGQHKNCPTTIHAAKYSPSKGAMALLPPVMRLKVLETLANNRHLSYNIFSNFPDADEFKTLMFSSVMRHRDRAESVWNKYQEIAYLGQDAEVIIRTSCTNCGEFEVRVKSTRVRTKTGLQATNLWNSFRYGCALCGAANKGIEVIGQINEQGTS